MDRALNLKSGINYCIPKENLGFRGAIDNSARLIPIPKEEDEEHDQIFFFHGVDVPADKLPYLPDMGPNSDFEKKGAWHHYQITKGIFIVHLTPNSNDDDPIFTPKWILQVIWFQGEECPRIFADNRDELISQGIITSQEIEDLLKANDIAMN